jgi:capsular exopolysaccharide synthesis family protein
MLALSLSIVRRRLDPRFYSAAEVESRLGLPVLSRVPRVEWLSGAAIVSAHQSEAWEAYRTLRTALLLNSEGEIPRVIQFTSVQAGEGKTLTSCNLAVALAAAGKRTVLIDADLRNGQVVKALELEPRAFGLSDLLSGLGSINGLLCPTRFPNLEVIHSGAIVSDPSALLSSPRMNELLGELKRSVDYVIVDSPAMVHCSDALVISASVDGVSLVLKEGGPGVGLVDEALCRLQRIGARVLGVTVNEGALAGKARSEKLIEAPPLRIEQIGVGQAPVFCPGETAGLALVPGSGRSGIMEASLIHPGAAPGFARLASPESSVVLRVLDRGAGESLASLVALEQKLWQERVEYPYTNTDVLIFSELGECLSIGGFTDTKVVDNVVQMNRGGGTIEHGPGQLTAFLIRSLGSVDPADYLKSFQRILLGTVSRLGLDPEGAKSFIRIGLSVKRKVSMHGAFINLTGPGGGIASLSSHYQPGLNDLKESFILSLMSEFKYSGVSVLSSVSGKSSNQGRPIDDVAQTCSASEGARAGAAGSVACTGERGAVESRLQVVGGS